MTTAEVDVPGIGNVKTEYVYAGGALVAGIAGYAWWKKRRSDAAGPVVLNPNDVVPATGYSPAPSGDSTVNVDGTAGKITTNSQWTSFVVDKISAYGFDPTTASVALGKWITHSTGPWVQLDIDIIRQAVGLAGYPPEGGPWPIPTVTTTPGTGGGGTSGAMKAPGGLHVNKAVGTVQIVWDADNATDMYRVEIRNKATGHLLQQMVPGPHGIITTSVAISSTDHGVVRTVKVIPMNATGDGPSSQIEYTS